GYRAQIEEDPKMMAAAGQVLVDVTPNARDFGTNRELEANTVADVRRLKASGKQLGYVNRGVYETVMAPGVQGIRDLQNAADMLKSVTNPDTPFKQLGAAATLELSRRIGYPLSPEMTYRQAARILMERGVKQGEAGKVDSPLFKE